MPNAERIAELQNEIRYLRQIIESSKDAEIKTLAAELIQKLQQRLQPLK